MQGQCQTHSKITTSTSRGCIGPITESCANCSANRTSPTEPSGDLYFLHLYPLCNNPNGQSHFREHKCVAVDAANLALKIFPADLDAFQGDVIEDPQAQNQQKKIAKTGWAIAFMHTRACAQSPPRLSWQASLCTSVISNGARACSVAASFFVAVDSFDSFLDSSAVTEGNRSQQSRASKTTWISRKLSK